MNDIRCLVAAYAINARIEGMKAENANRLSNGHAIAYNEDAFMDMACQLEQLAIDIARGESST